MLPAGAIGFSKPGGFGCSMPHRSCHSQRSQAPVTMFHASKSKGPSRRSTQQHSSKHAYSCYSYSRTSTPQQPAFLNFSASRIAHCSRAHVLVSCNGSSALVLVDWQTPAGFVHRPVSAACNVSTQVLKEIRDSQGDTTTKQSLGLVHDKI